MINDDQHEIHPILRTSAAVVEKHARRRLQYEVRQMTNGRGANKGKNAVLIVLYRVST